MKRAYSGRPLWAISVILLTVAAAVFLRVWIRRTDLKEKTYRIGWEADPPFQIAGPDGQPSGVGVDLVREAARRAGIKLRWSREPSSSEAALLKGRVDLWPLMTLTPAREKILYITQPYLESEQCILVPRDGPFKNIQDLSRARIGFYEMPMNRLLLGEYLPAARLTPSADIKSSIEDVCQNRLDGVFIEEYSAIMTLLDGLVCWDVPLRMIPVPGGRILLGVGSTFESSAAADAIREEIGKMAVEGKLAQVLMSWSYFSNRNLQSLEELLNARRRERWLIGAALLFASLFALSLWQAVHLHRERNRAALAESALRQAEQRIRLMADNLREMVLAYDMDRKLIYANPAVENLTGYSTEELKSRGFICWIHPDDQSRMLRYWEGLFQGKSFHETEYRLVTKGGEVRWASATWGPILDEAGRQVGVQGSEQNITERKLAEKELRQREEQLRQSQKMDAFGQLAGGIAHDFNNLLTLINGYADLMLEQLKKGDPLREYADEIQQAGDRAAGLTRQLLTFSRRQIVQARPLDLNDVVGTVTKMFQRILGEDIVLEAQLAAGGAPVFADPGMMEQVLMNLAVNSRDAMPKGGHLTIKTAVIELDADEARKRPRVAPGRYVRLSVNDTGTGIPPEHMAHIFEPFFTTKEVGKGTGLGLATVFGIVEQHKGWIDTESRLGMGTTVYVHLPCYAGSKPKHSARTAARIPHSATETVLLVEDEGAVRELARKGLERQGYRVIEAEDGPSALRLWARHALEIDLLLTDMVMPGGMNGLELAEKLRVDQPHLKVILATGYGHVTMGKEIQSGEDIRLLRKPYLPSELSRVVRTMLG